MKFWWASQTNNYSEAVSEGSLWTVADSRGIMRVDRKRIQSLRLNDVVFHYGKRVRGKNHIGAVSRVSSEAVPRFRPASYSTDDPTQRNDGYFVGVDVFRDDLEITFRRAFELVGYAQGGPFDRNDAVGQRYLSPLTVNQAIALLSEAGVEIPAGPRFETQSRTGETDREAFVTQRVEQSLLRAQLLAGAPEAACAMCGEVFPSRLLVAAHIKPRSELADDERWDFARVAMLACVLGCDALFEHGYVTVDSEGVISGGRRPESAPVEAAVEALLALPCGAWTELTQGHFAAHARTHQTSALAHTNQGNGLAPGSSR
jgi:hypothetical protein